jgi:uncharacterized protein
MKKTFFITTIALAALLPISILSQTKKDLGTNSTSTNPFSKSYDYVNDFEKILTPTQIATLKNTLKSCETKSQRKIIIVTTSSIEPFNDIPQYALQLHTYLDQKLKLNTAVLIVLSKEWRQIQVQGVEQLGSQLSDNDTKNIIATYALPEFKKGDYYKGLEQAVSQIIKKLQ